MITKITKNLNVICKMNKKEAIEIVKQFPAYQPAFSEIYFDKTINNWRLITNDNYPQEEVIHLMTDSNLCMGVDYRI